MKNPICIILILLFSFNMLNAQQPPKGADKIIVKNDKSAADNFLAVKLILAEKGIEIASQDKDIHQLKTGLTPITKYGAGAYYIIFCKDNSIQLSGFFNTGLALNMIIKDIDAFKPIVNRKLGLRGESWKSMNALALSIGSNLIYSGGLVKPPTKLDDVY